VLTSIAGRVLVANDAHESERSAYAALGACEDLALSRRSTPVPLPVEREPFPSYDEELRLTEAVLPAWMGIRFRQASPAERTRTSLADGAAAVLTVYPGSPADKARLSAGDIVLGPPGRPFTEPHQIREWVMTSPVGAPTSIDVLRDVHVRRVTLVPERYPLTWPALPGPPKIGSVAPNLPKLTPYRGPVPTRLGRGEPALLFFWATWCAPCKASLPEVLAFGRERSVPVIAITDERAEQLDVFFSTFREPFPSIVAMDDYRQAFLAFGVSGTPAFALVDGAGHVASYAVGYRPDVGIELTGWTWAGRPSPRSHD
jgi:thiol-disulfide isomerase/thioredoxin